MVDFYGHVDSATHNALMQERQQALEREKALEREVADYRQLLVALLALQRIDNHVRIWLGSDHYEVTIYDEAYLTTTLIVSEGCTLLAACENALAQYRLWDSESEDDASG